MGEEEGIGSERRRRQLVWDLTKRKRRVNDGRGGDAMEAGGENRGWAGPKQWLISLARDSTAGWCKRLLGMELAVEVFNKNGGFARSVGVGERTHL